MRLFLDSSVIAKLFIEEKGSEGAMEIMKLCDTKNIEIKASGLALYEVGNTILRNLGKKSRTAAEYMVQLFLLNMDYVPLDCDLASRAMEVAVKHEVTYYDAVHIATCSENKGELVTEDKVLHKKFDMTLNIKEALARIANHKKR
ncbi:MAG: type II toxin-antitoxin system VapC family toxin [Thermoplasmata archaeon]|nr:MAG: type II toxin-antitoxin system VapC family toxin [Thermoplasmata archaeon]